MSYISALQLVQQRMGRTLSLRTGTGRTRLPEPGCLPAMVLPPASAVSFARYAHCAKGRRPSGNVDAGAGKWGSSGAPGVRMTADQRSWKARRLRPGSSCFSASALASGACVWECPAVS